MDLFRKWVQHDDFFFWKVRETLPHLSLGSIICQKTLVVSECIRNVICTHRNVHGCRDRCEYTIRMWFQASCWVDGGAFYQSRYRRNKKNLKTINDYITLTFFKILWYDIKLWVGWYTTFSLSLSHSKLWSTEWSLEKYNIHTCLCFKMHVSDYYESNEGSCNSPIYNKW